MFLIFKLLSFTLEMAHFNSKEYIFRFFFSCVVPKTYSSSYYDFGESLRLTPSKFLPFSLEMNFFLHSKRERMKLNPLKYKKMLMMNPISLVFIPPIFDAPFQCPNDRNDSKCIFESLVSVSFLSPSFERKKKQNRSMIRLKFQ